MAIHLLLYGTSACHLCEQAAILLHIANHDNAIQWTEIDIAEDEALLQYYGTVIPVIRREDGAELHWPFTVANIQDWLRLPSVRE